MKNPKDVQVVFVIDMINDEMTNTIKKNLMDNPLVGALRNLGSDVNE